MKHIPIYIVFFIAVMMFIAYGGSSINNTIATNDATNSRISAFIDNRIDWIDAIDKNNSSDAQTVSTNQYYRLLAWNDLGMHCMDSDYSVFSILPPYNTLVAQLIKTDSKPAHITNGVTITYESYKSLDGKLNTTSVNKTNFWDYALNLFGVSLEDDVGLKGNPTASKTAHPLKYDSTHNWWIAEGIPITPKNDDGTYNRYPMVKVVAKDSNGNILAETITVLPVSDEMDCRMCHSSTSNYTDTKPKKGWVNLADIEKDFRMNILRLHDEKHPTAVSDNLTELQNKGYDYNPAGLEATANNKTPILCASCHKSNALPNSGIGNIKPLTAAIHSKHANAIDPDTNQRLNDSTNRNACYTCHPGAKTKCLRGVMGSNQNIQCQSCHGTMTHVGNLNREGWFDEPNCQSCHQNSQRFNTVFEKDNIQAGTLRTVLDYRFATNPNTPLAGKSLYRFSKGHGNLQCSACHGSTHAIYPSMKAEDNIQSIAAQGHTGTIAECTACHTTVPNTITGGPHGIHTVGQKWVSIHGNIVKNNGASACTSCHSSDYKGSPLSKTFSSRTFSTKWGNKTFAQGHQISCYDCYNGSKGD